MAPGSVAEDGVYNTEFRKCPDIADSSSNSCDDKDLSEEFLIELLCESEV